MTSEKQHSKSTENNQIESSVLRAEGGLRVALINHGATIQSLEVPGPDGPVNVVLGYENPEDYRTDRYYLGCTLGRYAGRINSGRFTLNDQSFQLDCNDETFGHILHSAEHGFSKKLWSVEEGDGVTVAYRHFSPAGEGGFPGNLETRVSYSLATPMSLQIDYEARSDADTIINLSNHSYFNLSGTDCSIEDHEVWINSELFLPMAPNMVPTGDVRHVADTEFDFRQVKAVSEGLAAGGRQLELTGGIDHFFLLSRTNEFPSLSASVRSPRTGIRMKCYTSQPGVQFYIGNSLAEPLIKRQGLCLEFQTAPDAPNHPGFPSAVLAAGEVYRQQIIFEFESA